MLNDCDSKNGLDMEPLNSVEFQVSKLSQEARLNQKGEVTTTIFSSHKPFRVPVLQPWVAWRVGSKSKQQTSETSSLTFIQTNMTNPRENRNLPLFCTVIAIVLVALAGCYPTLQASQR